MEGIEKLGPLEFLLGVVADASLPLRDRIAAATASAPYFNARLSTLRVIPQPQVMDEAALLALIEQIEQRLGKIPTADRARSLADQAASFIENVGQLPLRRQQDLLQRLVKDGQARLRQLEQQPQPGAVTQRNSRHTVIDHIQDEAVEDKPRGPVWGGAVNGNSHAATAAPIRPDKRIRFERDASGKLVRVD